MSLTACPDCAADLKGASKCKCGWKSAAVVQAQAAAERKITPCAADAACRYRGMLWVRTLAHNERVCVNHYYAFIDAHRECRHDPTVPPRMAGLVAKPVAGDE